MKTKRGANCLVFCDAGSFRDSSRPGPAANNPGSTPGPARGRPSRGEGCSLRSPGGFGAAPRTAPPSIPEPRPDAQPPNSEQPPPESAPVETEAPDRRQLDYANALFSRKLYDLAVPEYEKFLAQYPGVPGRSSAYFYLGECYRALNRSAQARASFQSVLDNYAESEFAGPASYGVAEILFNQKNYSGALTLFHRSAAKSKESDPGPLRAIF